MRDPRRPVGAWPCVKDYCGQCPNCGFAARREVRTRERQLLTYPAPTEPLTSEEFEQARQEVLGNIRVRLGAASPMSGEEVDELMAGAISGRSEEHWPAFVDWMSDYARGRAATTFGELPGTSEVEDIVADTREKVVRAILARSFLLTGVPWMNDMERAWHDGFTHVFPFRPWAARIIRNHVADVAKERLRTRGGLGADDADESRFEAPGATVDARAELGLARERVRDFLALIVLEQQIGRKRAEHMRHLLARLPHETVARLDAYASGALRLTEIPAAADDAAMAANLGTSVTNVENTRANYRKFLAREHPQLVLSFELLLNIALGRVDPLDDL